MWQQLIRAMCRPQRTFVAATLLLCICVQAVAAKERLSGDDEPARQADGMHACRAIGVVAGFSPANNWLLCLEFNANHWSTARLSEAADQLTIPAGVRGAGESMLGCRHSTEFVAGLNVASNRLRCVRLNTSTTNYLASATPAQPFTRRNLRFVEFESGPDAPRLATCPMGTALVGLHLQHRVLACAAPPICATAAECRDLGGGFACRQLRDGIEVLVCRSN
jgi:hypothetical protein